MLKVHPLFLLYSTILILLRSVPTCQSLTTSAASASSAASAALLQRYNTHQTTTPSTTTPSFTNPKQSAAAAAATTSSWFTAQESFGESALVQVQELASKVATANKGWAADNIKGVGGSVMKDDGTLNTKELTVLSALQSLEQDMQLLDRWVVQKPQLSPLEFSLLSFSVLAAACGPFLLNGEVTGVLAPSAAAFSAAIGIGAEYVGKVAVADGKEVAAATIQCAAEAEGFLANAERAKAVTPLCVGVSATAASFALLIPVLVKGFEGNIQLVTEIYLLSPLVALLATAVCSLAFEETKGHCSRAISVGNRRFAKSGLVGRTWLSTTEQIEAKGRNSSQKWQSFARSILPAPIIGALVPGLLPTKAIIVTALAGAQTAYYLAKAEYVVSRATDAVALKARSAAVCDTYANQGVRSAAILPFTSALSSLCAAATAAIVELPFLASLSGGSGVLLQSMVVATFPACSALLAGAASISKARCEVDAAAATVAASTLALEYTDPQEDPVLKPFKGVIELISLSYVNFLMEPFKRRVKTYYTFVDQWWKWATRKMRRGGSKSDQQLALRGI